MSHVRYRKLVDTLSQFYDRNRVQNAVNVLRNYYESQEFKDEDIDSDWELNIFEDSEGINVFMDELDPDGRVQSQENRKIIFQWISYCMLPNQPRPSMEPYSILNLNDSKSSPMKSSSSTTIKRANNQPSRPMKSSSKPRQNKVIKTSASKPQQNDDQKHDDSHVLAIALRVEREINQRFVPNGSETIKIANEFVKLCEKDDVKLAQYDLKDEFDENEGYENSTLLEDFMNLSIMTPYEQHSSAIFKIFVNIIHGNKNEKKNDDDFEQKTNVFHESLFAEYGRQFERKIASQITPVENRQKAEEIGNCFGSVCNEQKVDMDDLKTDFDEEKGWEHSKIFKVLIAKEELQPYGKLKEYFFNVLVMIIHQKDYVTFYLINFSAKASDENFKRAKVLCKRHIDCLLHNGRGKKNNDNRLLQAKSLDFENNFPFLLSTWGLFCRDKLNENKKYWNKHSRRSSEDTITCELEVLKPKAWFEQTGYYKHKTNGNELAKQQYGCLGEAAECLTVRGLKFINLNHKTGPTICDDLNVFAQYACTMNQFICNDFTKQDFNETYESNGHLPLQIDFCIIPRSVKMGVYNNAATDNYNDDDEKEDVDEQAMGIQNFGKNMQISGAQIWNMEEALNESGYVKDKDYWTDAVRPDKMALRQLWRDATVSKEHGRYKRYIIMIDRRNPQHIKNKRMVDDTDNEQTWQDQMYLIRPKEANEIAKEYDNVLNEIFIANTKKFLFPVPGDHQDLGGLDDANGYKFMISYHLHDKNNVKMYWYYGAGVTRFSMKDVEWLWPRFFKTDKKGYFQTLSGQLKNILNDAMNKYALRDAQFDEFQRQFKKFDGVH